MFRKPKSINKLYNKFNILLMIIIY